MTWASRALLLVALAGCGGDSSLTWVVRFEDAALGERALVVEVALREGGCEEDRAALYESELIAGAPAPDEPPTRTPPGRYGFWGRARDVDCQYFAEGCTIVELPREGEIALELAGTPEHALCPVDACSDGACRASAAAEVATGRAHSCARTWSGAVWCWGRNEEGQLGDGTTDDSHEPVSVSGVQDALQIATGGLEVGWQSHSCARQAPEGVVCWGFGQFGQLGDGGTTSRPLAAPVEGAPGALAVETGGRHTCAVVGGGGVRCWGANDRGQLGVAPSELATTPVELPLSGFVEVSAGEEHTCARNQAGPIWCWGANDEGQLGDGSTEDRFEPRDAGVPEYAIALSAGVRHTCAVVQSGAVYCWGRNADLEVGQEDAQPVPSPVRVEGIEDAAEVCAGNGVTCARRNDGHVMCWGNGEFGMRGDGQTDGNVATPVEALLIDDARDLAVGHNHACAVREGGEVWCWGRNQYGRLGDGTTADRAEPTRVLLDVAR